MIGRGRRPASPGNGEGTATGGAVLSEIEVLRIDATFRALPDHDSRPDGPSAAIDSSLMAAASIQASINRQRRRIVEAPAPQPNRGLTWLASLTAFVIALVVLGLAWEVGEKAYYDTPAPAVLTVATEAGPAPAEASHRGNPASPSTGTFNSPSSIGPRAGPAALEPMAAAPATEGRRPLYARERPAARRFGEPVPSAGPGPGPATDPNPSAATAATRVATSPPPPSPARDVWSAAPVTFP